MRGVERKTSTLQLRLSPELLARLQERAEREDSSVSDEVRRAVRSRLDFYDREDLRRSRSKGSVATAPSPAQEAAERAAVRAQRRKVRQRNGKKTR